MSMKVGLYMIYLGIFLVFLGSFVLFFQALFSNFSLEKSNKSNVNFGFFIGPFPLIFYGEKEVLYVMILIAVILFIIMFFYIYRYL